MIIERIVESFPVQMIVWGLLYALTRSSPGALTQGFVQSEAPLRSGALTK